MEKNFIEDLCEWLSKTKNITKINLKDLVAYIPEYEKYLENNKKEWISDYVNCNLCGYKWTAVYNINSERLECPNCNNMVIFNKL